MPMVKRSGMKLGGGGLGGGTGGIDQFVDRLKAEGEAVHEEAARLLDSAVEQATQRGDHAKRNIGGPESQTAHKEE